MRRSRSVIQILSVSVQAALLLLLFGLAGCGSDSDSDSTEPPVENSSLSGQLQKLVQEHGIPGAVGIVISQSSVTDVQAAGVRRSGTPAAVTTNDLFDIGSIVKSMTATMIARLVDDGVLSWDSKPADVIPGLSGSIHPGYSGITLLDLLRHRAGLPENDDFQDLADIPEFTGTLPQQRTQASIWVLSRPPAVSPGTYHYSNTGYTVAAAMAESATGLGWRELMDSLLFNPLGMNAYYGWPTDYDPQQPSGHDSNYQPVDSSIEPAKLRFMEPAGDISMSIFDLAKFTQLHIDGHQRRPHLLTQSAFDVLHTPVGEESEACGFQISFGSFGTLLWHNGSDGYFYSQMYIVPERDVAVAIIVNAGGDLTGQLTALAAETVLENFLP